MADELVTNGGFTGSLAGWTVDSPYINYVNNTCWFGATPVPVGQYLRQTIIGELFQGAEYTLRYRLLEYIGGDFRFSGDQGGTGITRSANGIFAETFTLSSAATQLRFGAATTPFEGKLDNVSLKRVNAPVLTVDEAALQAALRAARLSYVSQEQRHRTVLQTYVDRAGLPQPLSERALWAVMSRSFRKDYPNLDRRVRDLIEAYLLAIS